MFMDWTVYSFPYLAFSSSRMMEALWPLGVPNVRSSIPELAMRPVGRGVSVAMVREGRAV